MSDSNHHADVLREQHDPMGALARENESLRQRLATLESNVVSGGFAGVAPRYQLNEPGFYDDTLFAAGTVIDFTDTPNLTMVPMNEPARRAMDTYIAVLEAGARRKAQMQGREFFGLVTDRNVLIDQGMADAKLGDAAPMIRVPQVIGEVPAMPHTEAAQAQIRRGPGRPRRAQAVADTSPAASDLGAPMLAPAPSEARLGPAVVGHMVSRA